MTSVRYTNTFHDIFYFNLRALRRSPVQGIITFFIIAFLYSEIIKNPNRLGYPIYFVFFIDILTLISVFCILYVFSAVILYINLLVTVKGSKSAIILTEHIIEFDGQRIKETTKYNTSEFDWQGMHDVQQNRDYIFLYIAKNQGFVIPKRAIGYGPAIKVFNEMKSHLQAHKNKS